MHFGSSYDFKFDENQEILKQISREALSLCVSLYLQYIADENDLEEFKKVLIDNEIKFKKKS